LSGGRHLHGRREIFGYRIVELDLARHHISASSAVLKVLVIEPISKTEFLSSATYHNRPEVLKAVRDSGLRAVEARGNRL